MEVSDGQPVGACSASTPGGSFNRDSSTSCLSRVLESGVEAATWPME
jgi:hypothetical protein